MDDIASRIRELMNARGLSTAAFARLIKDKPQRVRDVLRGKQKAPSDMLESIAALPGVDMQYVIRGECLGTFPGIRETAARYDASGPWAENLLASYGLKKDDPMCEPVRGVDVAADNSPRVRNALASVVDVYAKRALAERAD